MLTVDQNNNISSKLPKFKRLFLFCACLLHVTSGLATGAVVDRKSVDMISSKIDHLPVGARYAHMQKKEFVTTSIGFS